MSTPKRPTLAELRKEARRVFGPKSGASSCDERSIAWVDGPPSTQIIAELYMAGANHRARLVKMLRALPDWRKP